MDAPETTVPATMTPEELTAKFEQLKASATKEYSLKNYAAAADFYSEAAQVQDEINGEMSIANADLLYQYGRCLYHVAVSNSDVLGGKVASAEEPKRKKRKVAPAAEAGSSAAAGSSGLIGGAVEDGQQKQAEEIVEAVVDDKDGMKKEDSTAASKPFFQITGDENFTDSEDDDDEADAEAEEEEDDFAIAYEILDVARVLLSKTLEAAQENAGKSTTENPEVRQVKERLADTHDLQAEISLENERFHDAINDTRDALALKLELFPQENSLVAEAHFKLSLALEFASVTSANAEEGAKEEPAQVDEGLRKEAAAEMEKAIASCKLRVEKEEAALASLEGAKLDERKCTIVDVREMVGDMEQRLIDLRNPAVSLAGPTGPAGAPDGSDPLRGVLGAMLGESKADQQKRIAEATKGANDLTGLVKHRKKPKVEDAPAATNGASEGKGKRKAEDAESEPNGKKAKVEDA